LDGLLIGLLIGLYSGLRSAGKRWLAMGAPLGLLALVVLLAWSSKRFIPVQAQFPVASVSVPVYYVFDALDLPAPDVPKLAQLLPTPVPAPASALPTPVSVAPSATPTREPAAARQPTSTPLTEAETNETGAWTAGDRVRVVTQGGARLTVRSKPNRSAAVVTRVNAGTVLQIVAGPESANGFQWWQVQGDGFKGWAAQNWLVKTP
jgi:hypothetical protein